MIEDELITVVLCTYNGIKFIGPQLNTIQNQTYKFLEIIIVDDASTDGTYEWLQIKAREDDRIKLFKNKTNLGFNLNFNNACTYATGGYIAIADQDDVWELNKIEILFSAIKQKKDTVLVHCISARFEKENKPHLRSHKLINHFHGNDPRQFLLKNIISGHNMLIKKELLQNSMPFPKEVYYDWWLVINACSIGKIEAVEEILVWHRMHGNNATGGGKPFILFYKQTQINLPVFLSVRNLPKNYYTLGKELLLLYNELPEKLFSLKLFIFLLKYSRILFAHKKRVFPWISYTKNAFRFSKATHLA
ncbi:MAG: glycosyltransferase [Chitinophagaceae bacterium]|nr:glycosyltransferase [Chitinophagaceae bacterium]